MHTSTNKDIAMRQNLLSVAGKNTIPPQHIVEQQKLSETQLASQCTKIIPLEHRELCPLCHCPSFIFVQSKYSKNGLHHTSYSSPLSYSSCGTFSCSKCCNLDIKIKLIKLNQLRREIAQKSKLIEPILRQKVDAPNSKYYDKRFKMEQIKQRIHNLRQCIQQTQKENKLLKNTNDKLHIENKQRYSHLQHYESKLNAKWKSVLLEKRQQYEIEEKRANINDNICTQISLSKLLQISDFYAMKVLPTMHMKGNEARQLSMIQNIAVPSVFKTRSISAFYNNEQNELFRFPVAASTNLHINIASSTSNMPYFNRSSSSLLNYKSSQYRVALKTSANKGSSSPLQKYIPRFTNSISSFSEKMGIQMLTPPAYRHRDTINKESKSLPKNLDDLILPPTFFSDEETDKNETRDENKKKQRRTQKKKEKLNKISDRGRSHSFDALPVHNAHCRAQRLIHEPHMEHGICAALQYIVSFVLRAAKYLNVQLLYKMGLFRKSKRGQFIMHTFIENKGKYFRLYWIEKRDFDVNVMETNQEEKESGSGSGSEGNILEFQHGLHLLQENINHLSIKCGVKSSRLHYFQLIANLNTLISHLKLQSKKYSDGEKVIKNVTKHRIERIQIGKPQIEALNIINDYESSNNLIGDNLNREHSKSQSHSHSHSASHSELLLSPPADSEHDDWDFVDYN